MLYIRAFDFWRHSSSVLGYFPSPGTEIYVKFEHIFPSPKFFLELYWDITNTSIAPIGMLNCIPEEPQIPGS